MRKTPYDRYSVISDTFVGVVLLLQAIYYQKENRSVAIISMCGWFYLRLRYRDSFTTAFPFIEVNAMGIWFMMLGFNLLIPAIMLGAGKFFSKNSPKNINWIFGYRTTMSMKNEDTWAFAHKIAGAFWWKWGWVALALAAAAMLLVLGRSEDLINTTGCLLMFAQMIPLIAVIPHTEKALRNTFDKNGNRKEIVSC